VGEDTVIAKLCATHGSAFRKLYPKINIREHRKNHPEYEPPGREGEIKKMHNAEAKERPNKKINKHDFIVADPGQSRACMLYSDVGNLADFPSHKARKRDKDDDEAHSNSTGFAPVHDHHAEG
jgi:hypothetical protein